MTPYLCAVVAFFTLVLIRIVLSKGPFSIERKGDALLSRYQQYGRIFKETIAGKTIVHLADPEYFKTVYAHEGRIPHIPPLLETTQLYRKYRGLSPGLGNT